MGHVLQPFCTGAQAGMHSLPVNCGTGKCFSSTLVAVYLSVELIPALTG